MPRLIWLVLKDGRSVVAGCSTTKDHFARALAEPERTLTLTSDDSVEHIPAQLVRGFVMFDAVSQLPPSASIYRIVQL